MIGCRFQKRFQSNQFFVFHLIDTHHLSTFVQQQHPYFKKWNVNTYLQLWQKSSSNKESVFIDASSRTRSSIGRDDGNDVMRHLVRRSTLNDFNNMTFKCFRLQLLDHLHFKYHIEILIMNEKIVRNSHNISYLYHFLFPKSF